MSHIYAISDIHAHPYASGVQRGNNGTINFRLQNCLDCLEAALKASVEDKAPLLIGGDLAHAKDETPQIVTDLLFDLFSKYPTAQVYAISGNHDFIDKDGKRTILGVLRDNISVLSEPTQFTIQDPNIILTAVPFVRDLGTLRDTISKFAKVATPGYTRVLLAHAYTRELMQKHEGLTTNDLSAKFFSQNFDLVLLGHHHVHDVLDFNSPLGTRSRVVSIGSPLQLTFGDRGQSKGFLRIGIPNLSIDQIQTNMPRFVEIDDSSKFKPADVQNSFVRVKVSSGADLKSLQKKLEKTDVLKVSFEHAPAKRQERISGLRASMPDDEVMKKYLEGNAPPADLDAKKLIGLSKKYMLATV